MQTRRTAAGFLLLMAFVAIASAQETVAEKALPGWPAPLLWKPQRLLTMEERSALENGALPQQEQSAPASLPLIAITPCRLIDTRGNGFTGQYGPPALAAGSPRSFTLTGQCGIAGTAQAVSLNITVTNTLGPGFIKIFPEGGASPVVSTLNYIAGQTVANAALVPLGAGGGVTIAAGVSGADLIVDTNGYYDAAGLITQVSPGTGLSGGGTSGNVTLGIAAGGVTPTELAANAVISTKIAANAVTAGAIASGQVVKSVNGLFDNITLSAGSNVTITPTGNTLTIASTGGPPSGPAGGSLSGSYPNPGIATGAIGNSQIAAGAVTDASVTGPIAYSKMGGAATGGILFGGPSGAVSQDAANLFWDSTNHRLGLGTATPGQQLELTGMMSMPATAATSGVPSAGVLFAGTQPFLHNYYSPPGGCFGYDCGNTFLGLQAGNSTLANGFNTALGYQSLHSDTSGQSNTAVGYWSLLSNTSGGGNTALGLDSLASNTKGIASTAVGEASLEENTTAGGNTAIGSFSLELQSYSNADAAWASYNTAVGYQALENNNPISTSTAVLNTAVGAFSLVASTTGFQNTALGVTAGARSGGGAGYGGPITYVPITTGNYNTFIGEGTGATATDVSNCTAVGIDAYCDGNNQVRLGNPFVTSIGGEVGWSALSDVRGKKDIRDISLGLDFVLQLRPVEYELKRGNGRTDMGFVAQDIEALLGDDHNVLTVGGDSDRTLSLRYTDLIAPLVKAVQEQNRVIEELRARVQELEKQVQR